MMVNIIKRGGFREKAARQSKYKDSVNHQANIPEHEGYNGHREQEIPHQQPDDKKENPKST